MLEFIMILVIALSLLVLFYGIAKKKDSFLRVYSRSAFMKELNKKNNKK